LTTTIPAVHREDHRTRDPFSGHTVVTGGIVTVEDSNWLMSWTAEPPAAVPQTSRRT
jgi:myosin-crossreactive antigen